MYELLPPIERIFNNVKVTFDPNKTSITFSRQVAAVVAQARAKHSKLHDFPMDPGETPEEWEIRYRETTGKELDDDKIIRRKNESVEEHIERLNMPAMQAQDEGLDIINGIQRLQRERARNEEEARRYPDVSEEDYNASQWLKTKAFIWTLLDALDIVAPEFRPKRPQPTIKPKSRSDNHADVAEPVQI